MSVDIDQTKLDLGKFKYPDALIKNCDIESFLNTQASIQMYCYVYKPWGQMNYLIMIELKKL